jgi:hypothetical protein
MSASPQEASRAIDNRRAIACLEEALELARELHGFRVDDLPEGRPHAARVTRRQAARKSRLDLLRAANLARLGGVLLEGEEYRRQAIPIR